MDDALRQGDDLVTDFDSMLAKLIVHGSDREECLSRARRALSEYDIAGIPTIIPFHRLMLTDEMLVERTHHTKYLDEGLETERIEAAQEKWGAESSQTTGDGQETTTQELTVEVDRKRFDVQLETGGLPVNNTGRQTTGGGSSSGETTGDSGGDQTAVLDGQQVKAEMQGTILDINVAEGDTVAASDVICVLETMKMENDIVAPADGTVTGIAVSPGDSVEMGDPLIALD